MVYFFFSFFSPADLIFSSSACTRKFILLSFADAQVSISPLTDYTSRFRSTSFRYSIRFAIPHQPIRRSPDRSVDRSVARSIARSIARSLGRSFGRSIGRSVARSIVRSFSQSLSPPPSLPLPVSIPRFPYPFPCISHPSPSPSGFVDWNKTFISHSILVLQSCFGVLICFGVLGVCEDAHGIEGSVLNRGGFQLNSGALESTFRVTTSVRGDEGARR